MRVGLLNFFVTKPLEYGLRRSNYVIIEADPTRLCKLLLAGELDCALINSVDLLRHQEVLGSPRTLGVCANGKIGSAIYIKRKEQANRKGKITRLWTNADAGISVMLWKFLYLQSCKQLPEISSSSAETIPRLIEEKEGGVIVGDFALQFPETAEAKDFVIYDLGEWWYEIEQMSFIFFQWAYQINNPIDDGFFYQSFKKGWNHLENIVSNVNIPNAYEYITKVISYELSEEEHKAMTHFQMYLLSLELL